MDETSVANLAEGAAALEEKEADMAKRYNWDDQRTAILRRPDTHVGASVITEVEAFVLDPTTRTLSRRVVKTVPCIELVFDEILVNAADRATFTRMHGIKDKTNAIDVTIDGETGRITVRNNGEGIPYYNHPKSGDPILAVLFGELNTSSNHDDTKQRLTGGRNGYGATLTNIFSTEFRVTSRYVLKDGDVATDGLRIKKSHHSVTSTQAWSDNAASKGPFSAKPTTERKGFTEVSFVPDYKRFKLDGLTPDLHRLFCRRVLDIAATGINGVTVTLNGQSLPCGCFPRYAAAMQAVMVTGEPVHLDAMVATKKTTTAADSIEETEPAVDEACALVPLPSTKVDLLQVKGGSKEFRWEVCAALRAAGMPEQVSFVNSIHTPSGGTHVAHIQSAIRDALKAKMKGSTSDANAIVRNTVVYVNARVVNPVFKSQSKEELAMPRGSHGRSLGPISPAFFGKVAKSGVITAADRDAAHKEQVKMEAASKMRGSNASIMRSLSKIKNYDPANRVGSRGAVCTLYVVEGLSAKTLITAGLQVVGRDFNGVFPLKGKPMNVRKASEKQVMANVELMNLVHIIGLQFGKTYDSDSIKGLHYQRIVVAADQDYDGSHIKGLLVSFFHHFWPSLATLDGFIRALYTPIIRAIPKKAQPAPKRARKAAAKSSTGKRGRKKEASVPVEEAVVCREGNAIVSETGVWSFFSVVDFETWTTSHRVGDFNIKYYKGLGSSRPEEAKDYFRMLGQVLFSMSCDSAEDAAMIELFFGKDTKPRTAFARDTVVTDTTSIDFKVAVEAGHRIPFADFGRKEFSWFTDAANRRALPHVMDGLKPSQRQALYTLLAKRIVTSTKVASLAGAVTDFVHYMHGSVSMEKTIVNMAQTYPGSGNNINFFVPDGQFGTRAEGGEDAAQARYIFTKKNDIADLVFPPVDMPLLKRRIVEGGEVEPVYFVPVIPMALVNGSTGVGWGNSNTSQSFSPFDMIEWVRARLESHTPPSGDWTPWFRGFKGSVSTSKNTKKWVTSGIWEWKGDVLYVNELPIGTWTATFNDTVKDLLSVSIASFVKDNAKQATTAWDGAPWVGAFTKASGGVTLPAFLGSVSKKAAKASRASNRKRTKPGDDGPSTSVPKGLTSQLVRNVRNNSSGDIVSFEITFHPLAAAMMRCKTVDVTSILPLTSTVAATNVVMYRPDDSVHPFKGGLEEIAEEHFKVRMELYEKRRSSQLAQLDIDIGVAEDVVAFIDGVVEGKVQFKCSEDDTDASIASVGVRRRDANLCVKEGVADGPLDGFGFVLRLQALTLTKSKADGKRRELARLREQKRVLSSTSAKDLWRADLDVLETGLRTFYG